MSLGVCALAIYFCCSCLRICICVVSATELTFSNRHSERVSHPPTVCKMHGRSSNAMASREREREKKNRTIFGWQWKSLIKIFSISRSCWYFPFAGHAIFRATVGCFFFYLCPRVSSSMRDSLCLAIHADALCLHHDPKKNSVFCTKCYINGIAGLPKCPRVPKLFGN